MNLDLALGKKKWRADHGYLDALNLNGALHNKVLTRDAGLGRMLTKNQVRLNALLSSNFYLRIFGVK